MNQHGLFKCAKCSASTFGTVEKDKGDFIVRCSLCGAVNILDTMLLNKIQVPTFEITGWRE
jgi:uncharacterized Zn finger protein